MKVDPNQDVRPMLVALTATTQNGAVRETYTHEGGIPLRLHIAAQFTASQCANPNVMENDWDVVSRQSLAFADALIDAHNQTCEVKSE